jgi:hypothetical protein
MCVFMAYVCVYGIWHVCVYGLRRASSGELFSWHFRALLTLLQVRLLVLGRAVCEILILPMFLVLMWKADICMRPWPCLCDSLLQTDNMAQLCGYVMFGGMKGGFSQHGLSQGPAWTLTGKLRERHITLKCVIGVITNMSKKGMISITNHQPGGLCC